MPETRSLTDIRALTMGLVQARECSRGKGGRGNVEGFLLMNSTRYQSDEIQVELRLGL
jgi:hypothetical protein